MITKSTPDTRECGVLAKCVKRHVVVGGLVYQASSLYDPARRWTLLSYAHNCFVAAFGTRVLEGGLTLHMHLSVLSEKLNRRRTSSAYTANRIVPVRLVPAADWYIRLLVRNTCT